MGGGKDTFETKEPVREPSREGKGKGYFRSSCMENVFFLQKDQFKKKSQHRVAIYKELYFYEELPCVETFFKHIWMGEIIPLLA